MSVVPFVGQEGDKVIGGGRGCNVEVAEIAKGVDRDMGGAGEVNVNNMTCCLWLNIASTRFGWGD